MAPTIGQVKLGSQGLVVPKQGLGCLGMSMGYGPPKPEKDMIELIHHAVDTGITFLDTSDMYGPHTNEVLVGKAVKGMREKVQIATKCGLNIKPGKVDGEYEFGANGTPEYVRACAEGSLKRLDIDCIDLYYLHRLDKDVPIEVTVGAMKALVDEGKVKYLGLSEASSSEIRRAHSVHPITAVQMEWSLWTRDIEEDIVPTCRELGIGVVAYSPLGHGFFSGVTIAEFGEGDFRKGNPRTSGENYVKNRKFYEKLVEIGKRHNRTPGQLALAWVQHQGEDVVPIPGTTKIKNFDENVGALDVVLSKEEIQEIEAAVPIADIAGNRYDDNMMEQTWRQTSTPPLESWKG